MVAPNLKTKRLLLRQWKEDDLLPFAKMNADKRVMEWFPSILTSEESNALAKMIQKELQEKEYGFWAVEVPDIAPFIGFIGLNYEDFESFFIPCIEIGWRLAYEYWEHGYATEGAKAVVDYAFKTLKLKEIVSFTAINNIRSRRVMEKLGMKSKSKENFHHPKVPPNFPMHVLYRFKNPLNN